MPLQDYSVGKDASQDLCFDSEAFLKESFSIDEFLRDHRHKATLEELRNDLGIYLKTLRLSMIELINKDYEDFVNLSKDLVGLNTGIEFLQSPLQQVKSEVLVVKSNLEDTINGLHTCLEEDKEIKNKKNRLSHLKHLITSLAKLQNLLQDNPETPKDALQTHNLDLIERVGQEYHMVLFSASKCNQFLSKNQKQDLEEVGIDLMGRLGNAFLESLRKSQSSQLSRCLRIYASLEKVTEAEKLVREKVIAPFLHETVNETALQKEPTGLRGIYEKIIDFSNRKLAELIVLARTGGFNFLLNSLWVELEHRMEVHMFSVFAAGDPDVFRVRYNETSGFLLALQQRCATTAEKDLFLSHPQMLRFRQKWNLLVYFKIRYQEIAGQLESSMQGDTSATAAKGSPYQLNVSAMTAYSVQRCWDDQILLTDVLHLFWKLSLQIISRFSTWIKEETDKDKALESKTSADPLNPSAQSVTTALRSRLNFLVCLSYDLNILATDIKRILDPVQEPLQSAAVTTSLEEALNQLKTCQTPVTNSIVNLLVRESVIYLSHVSAIPRLFRRTNRESPTKPCDYVSQLLRLPIEFYLAHREKVTASVMDAWMVKVLSEISESYRNSVSEVLTNAQKTEESLRRLKKAKERSSGVVETRTGSDDDKIRHQLVIDVHKFCEDVDSVGVSRNDVSHLTELLTLVESARENAAK